MTQRIALISAIIVTIGLTVGYVFLGAKQVYPQSDYDRKHDVHTTLRPNERVDTTQSAKIALTKDSIYIWDKNDSLVSAEKLPR